MHPRWPDANGHCPHGEWVDVPAVCSREAIGLDLAGRIALPWRSAWESHLVAHERPALRHTPPALAATSITASPYAATSITASSYAATSITATT